MGQAAEPSGMMDVKWKNASEGWKLDGGQPKDCTVCDLADEEVHFSRNASNYYYYYQVDNQAAGRSHPGGSATTKPDDENTSSAKCHTSSNFYPLDTGSLNFGLITSPPDQLEHGAYASYDQARSIKLFHSIGSKLRRGSNYLNAPTKLLGHYLLGIKIQSWSEFFNTSRLTRAPTTRHQLARRLATNLSQFQGNYLCLSMILVLYCILTSPLLLVVIAAYLLALYLVTMRSALGKQTRVFGYRLNLQQQYSFITMMSLPPLWIAGAPSAVFWVIGASFFVVGLHASMFINDQVMSEQLAEAGARSLVYDVTSRRQATALCQPGGEFGRPHVQYHRQAAGSAEDRHGPVSLTDSLPGKTPTSTGSSQTATGGSYVSSTISRWITFGGSAAGDSKYLPTRGQEGAGARTSEYCCGRHQVPDVKIVSHDYAGLGRVYEI